MEKSTSDSLHLASMITSSDIRYGGIRMALKLGLPAMKRIMHYEDYSASVRLNATGGREWYWYNLVVRPEAQGQHLVGKLLRPMLEYCSPVRRRIR